MKSQRIFSSIVVGLALLLLSGAASLFGQTNSAPAAPAANPVPPASAPAKRSQADLEKLVAPIALYPDQLVATILPASAYPLEIVEAAWFIKKDTNNVSKLDEQRWDDSVKAVARIPEVLAQMDENLSWTSDLGDAFINQPKEIMDAIQTMRTKAQSSGALKTTPEQVVAVTNTVVTNVVEKQVVTVTNQVVQIQPAQPEVIYVPKYNPAVVYGGYPVAYPGYYYPPPGSVALTFGVGMAVGAIVANNNCDWGHGGTWHSDVDVNVNRNVNSTVNRNVNRTGNANVNRNGNANANANRTANANANRQKWQPDPNRLKNSGSSLSTAQNREARGWSSTGAGSSGASTTARASPTTSRPTPTGSSAERPSSANASRPSGESASRPSSGQSASRPSSGQSASRPSSGQSASRPSSGRSATRPSSPNASGSPSQGSRSTSTAQGSAFSGGNASQARAASSRGSMSRGGGGMARAGGGGRR